MDIATFIDNFAGQFDDAPIGLFKLESAFRDIPGWSSLTALSIIAMVDEEYGIQLSGDDIRASRTIQDVFKKVVEKKG